LLNSVNIFQKNLVINFDLPNKYNIDNYVYRVGNNIHENKNRLVINILNDDSELEIIHNIMNNCKEIITEFTYQDFEFIYDI
jgi:superfamily II DNA/RNA helicase